VSGSTAAPPAETGLGEIDDQVVVTVLETDLNEAVAVAFNTAPIAAATLPPEVTLEAGYQLQIVVVLTNEFLDEQTVVTLRAIAEIVGGRIRLKEVQENRQWTGPTPSDQDIWQVLEVVERGINDTVFDLLGTQPSALTLVNLRQIPDSPQVRARLEVFFAPQAG
jgi:hypothetical protein